MNPVVLARVYDIIQA